MAGGNQFAGLIGRGQRNSNEEKMADLLNDMQTSKTGHHGSLIRMFTKKDSKEYQDVEKTLTNVVFDTSDRFTNDVAANEKMVTKAIADYYKLLVACEKYLGKKGGTSDKGAARKEKVRQIYEYAQRDLGGIEQSFHAMKGMSAQEQSRLVWDDIIHSARMEEVEVEDYSEETALGAGAKTGENVGRLLNEGVFAPNQQYQFGDGGGANIENNALYDLDISQRMKEEKMVTNMANRNVATSRVANLIGVGDIVEQSMMAKVKDKKTGDVKTGSLMTKARGKEMKDTLDKEVRESLNLEKNILKREQMVKDMISPTMQKQLSSLQVLDYLCGQADRHRANYFVEKDAQGKFSQIHGIDNDMSFSTGYDTIKDLIRRGGVYNLGGAGAHQRAVVDSEDNLLIPHMDRQLAKNILDLKPEELKFVLKDLLEPAFIDVALIRLQKLQNGIRKEMENKDSTVFLNDSQWGDNTMEDFLASGFRRKVSSKVAGREFESKRFFDLQFKTDEAVELTKNDNYIASLVDDMMGFDLGKGCYSSSENKAPRKREAEYAALKANQKSFIQEKGLMNFSDHRKAYMALAMKDKARVNSVQRSAMSDWIKGSTSFAGVLRNPESFEQMKSKALTETARKDIDNMEGLVGVMDSIFSDNAGLEEQVEVYRGVSDEFLGYLLEQKGYPKENYLNKDGKTLNYQMIDKMGLLKGLVGMTYQDNCFVSTTTNRGYAAMWVNSVEFSKAKQIRNEVLAQSKTEEGSREREELERYSEAVMLQQTESQAGGHMMIMNVPAGTKGVFADAMGSQVKDPTKLFGAPQNEITLDRGLLYKITDVSGSAGSYQLYVTVVGSGSKKAAKRYDPKADKNATPALDTGIQDV